MPTAESGDVDVYFEESGTGEPVVWIPGTGLLGSSWQRHQVATFADRYRCLTLDLRGSGQTRGGQLIDLSVKDLAGDVSNWMDRLAIPAAGFVGMSLGSAVIQELALTRPDLVRCAVLVSTWSSSAQEHHIRRHFESRLYALEHGPLDVFAQFAFWMSAPSLFDNEPALQRRVESDLAAHMSSRMDGTAAHFRADLAHNTATRLHNIRCPTLVVYGAEDLITLPWYNERVAQLIPGAAAQKVPGAGHLLWLERPELLNRSIAEFMLRNL